MILIFPQPQHPIGIIMSFYTWEGFIQVTWPVGVRTTLEPLSLDQMLRSLDSDTAFVT